MAYYGVDLHNSITLGRIFSIHYFEYMSDFSFEGESHNFWEFVCVMMMPCTFSMTGSCGLMRQSVICLPTL